MTNKQLIKHTTPIKFLLGDVVKHIVTGNYYKIIGLPDEYVIEETEEPAYSYTGVAYGSKRKWIRSQKKMEDGRFVLYKTNMELYLGHGN